MRPRRSQHACPSPIEPRARAPPSPVEPRRALQKESPAVHVYTCVHICVRTHVDEVRRVAAAADAVEVDLRARPARPLVAHLPKVVLAAKGQDALLGEEAQPDGPRLVVGGQALLLVAAEVGRVEPLARQLVDLFASVSVWC